MRTLSAELTAAQRATNNVPYIQLVFTTKDGATTNTYATDDSTNRILRVRTAEGMYGSALFESQLPNGKSIGIAAQIILNNSDNEFTSKDLRGTRVQVRFGFESYWNGSSQISISGTKFSEGEPFIVFNSRDATSQGISVTELWCMPVWEVLELSLLSGDSFGDTFPSTGSTIRQLLMTSLGRNATQIWMFDDSAATFTDRTTVSQALDNTAGGWTWLVDASDILYIGVDDSELNEFDRISIEAVTEGVGTWTIVWEFYNGTSWTALSNVVDGTDAGKDVQGNGISAVPRTISFDHPSTWAAVSINSVTKRYIRARVSSSTTVTTNPTITRISVSKTIGFQIDDLDAFDTVLKPEYTGTIETSSRDLFRDILTMTRYAPVMTAKYMQVNVFDDSPGSTDYDYSLGGDHTFFTSERERAVVVPNKVIAVRFDNETALTNFIGTAAEDSASQADIGIVTEIIVDNSIASTSDSTTRAARRLSRYQHEVYQGEIVAPINIGQEPWDWIGVTDGRLSVTYTGRVGRIIKEYDWYTGSYRIQISLGILRSSPTTGLAEAFIGAGTLGQITRSAAMLRRAQALVETRDPSVLPELQELFDQGVEFNPPEAEQFRTAQRRGTLTNIANQTRVPPDIPLARGDVPVGLPHWFGLAPNTGNYKQVSARQQSNARGLAENEPRFRTIFLPDFQGGGYAPMQVYNDGAGNIVFDGEAGTGTDIDALKTTRAFRWQETGGGANYFGLKAPASLAGDVDMVLPDGDGTANQVLKTDGSGTLSWASGSGGATVPDFQRFTGDGTWTKPPGAIFVYVEDIAGGGGGGGGEGRATGNARNPGAGGGGGGSVSKLFSAAALGATETITIGSGGAGGAGGTNASGSDGSVGGDSSFGSWLKAFGGGGGQGGQGSPFAGGGSGGGSAGAGNLGSGSAGVIGGDPSMTDANGLGDVNGHSGGGGSPSSGFGGNADMGGGGGGAIGGSSMESGAGGGGGGSVNSGGAANAGSAGGASHSYSAGGGGSGGSAGGGSGGTGDSLVDERGGSGGGGGGGNNTANGGAGGIAGTPGGGGGGGGGGTNTGGAGRIGGRGEVRIWSW